MQMHASCAARNGEGVLLLGPSAVGKSSLLLQLLERGFDLVADDVVALESGTVSPPEALAGLLEIRGLGIIRLPYVAPVRATLVVRLQTERTGSPCRLPEPERDPALDLPVIRVDPRGGAAARIVALALDCAMGRVTQVVGAFAA